MYRVSAVDSGAPAVLEVWAEFVRADPVHPVDRADSVVRADPVDRAGKVERQAPAGVRVRPFRSSLVLHNSRRLAPPVNDSETRAYQRPCE